MKTIIIIFNVWNLSPNRTKVLILTWEPIAMAKKIKEKNFVNLKFCPNEFSYTFKYHLYLDFQISFCLKKLWLQTNQMKMYNFQGG